MLGSSFHPSYIENEIYDIMEAYIAGIDLYEERLINRLIEFFKGKYSGVEWLLSCNQWPGLSAGTCSISWIENGHLHMINFDYTKVSE